MNDYIAWFMDVTIFISQIQCDKPLTKYLFLLRGSQEEIFKYYLTCHTTMVYVATPYVFWQPLESTAIASCSSRWAERYPSRRQWHLITSMFSVTSTLERLRFIRWQQVQEAKVTTPASSIHWYKHDSCALWNGDNSFNKYVFCIASF